VIARAVELLSALRLRALRGERPATRVSGELPQRLTPGMHRVVQLEVRNRGTRPLRTAGREPVHIGSRWFDEAGAYVVDGPRARLWPALWPRRSQTVELMLAAPAAPGRYDLRVAPVREFVAWFDDLDPDNGLRAPCAVAPSEEADPAGLPGLSAMIAQTEEGPQVFRPSEFWVELCALHASHLQDEASFANFKRTVNFFYFQFAVAGRHHEMYGALAREFLRRPTLRVLAARMPGAKSAALPEAPPYERPWLARSYAIYVAMLWEVARSHGAGAVLDGLEEPALGRPLEISYRGRRISQDLANSALELSAVLDVLPAPLSDAPRVLEIGGGYGRLAWAVLSTVSGARYVLVDVAPALALAQRYLTSVFPDLPAFRFRRFDDGDEVRDELAAARIAFLTPDQLELVDPLEAEIALTVSSLHEMLPALVRRYLELVDRHCDGVFYTKQWKRWHNPVDDVVMAREDYPYPATWGRLFERPCPTHPAFFEAAYATRRSTSSWPGATTSRPARGASGTC
jgi:putative sugar O-methyltransferase